MAGPSRILIAGCSDTDIEFVTDVTSSLDRVIEIVHLGSECHTKLQLFQPHLVLLDTTISDPDAFQLCRDIKSDHTAMVVIVTGVSELGNIKLGVEAGTDSFLPKPLLRSEVLRGINDLLALRIQGG